MQIICKRRLQFDNHEIVDNLKTGEKVALVKTKPLIISPNVNPQLVPDWIKTTDMFQLGVETEIITEVAILSKPKNKSAKSAAVDSNMPEKTDKPNPPQTGWGASPQMGLPIGAK